MDRLDCLKRGCDDIQNELKEQRLELQKQQIELDELSSLMQKELLEWKNVEEELGGMIESRNDKFAKRLDALEPFRLYMLSIRATQLEMLSPHFDGDACFQRNEVVYGGNIELDLQALEHLEDYKEFHRFKNARMGFQLLYGQPADEPQSDIVNAPKETVGSCYK